MIIGETSNPGDLSSEVKLRIVLSEPDLSQLTGGNICNTGDPANDGATGIPIRNAHDAEKATFHSLLQGDCNLELDALARKHTFNVGTNGGERGFAHHLGHRPPNDFTDRQAYNRRVRIIGTEIAMVAAAAHDTDARGVQRCS